MDTLGNENGLTPQGKPGEIEQPEGSQIESSSPLEIEGLSALPVTHSWRIELFADHIAEIQSLEERGEELSRLAEELTPHLRERSLSDNDRFKLAQLYLQQENPEADTFARKLLSYDHSYHDRRVVNGTEISVAYDRGYQDYTIYLPQIDLSVAWEREVSDQVLRISQEDSDAQKVFEFAVKAAEYQTDVYELYKEISQFIRDECWQPQELTEMPLNSPIFKRLAGRRPATFGA